jgi:hypothetical protein
MSQNFFFPWLKATANFISALHEISRIAARHLSNHHNSPDLANTGGKYHGCGFMAEDQHLPWHLPQQLPIHPHVSKTKRTIEPRSRAGTD